MSVQSGSVGRMVARPNTFTQSLPRTVVDRDGRTHHFKWDGGDPTGQIMRRYIAVIRGQQPLTTSAPTKGEGRESESLGPKQGRTSGRFYSLPG